MLQVGIELGTSSVFHVLSDIMPIRYFNKITQPRPQGALVVTAFVNLTIAEAESCWIIALIADGIVNIFSFSFDSLLLQFFCIIFVFK